MKKYSSSRYAQRSDSVRLLQPCDGWRRRVIAISAVLTTESRLPQELAEDAERPRAAPVGGAAPPRIPRVVGGAVGDPAGLGQKRHARSHKRLELAAHPRRERQREALLGTIDRRGRQRARQCFVQPSLLSH